MPLATTLLKNAFFLAAPQNATYQKTGCILSLKKKSEFFPCFELVFGYKACLFKRLLKILEKQENLNRDIRKKARKSEMTKNHEKMKEKREFKKLRKNQRK